ncbi:MAG: HesA/MoeB/ThiF family protein [Candidatus Pedobacter colombiensis]|uniref:Molybdopterin-synthase adenylyltransferase n=1 Tax=Candidatus Pedobacter colombiensis TaxID=3121371 RepID=A0AAJ6B4D6_9SPHI|nr:HesA/MoeB/ThiF family protein [Pedobacter sp.]WEK17492.1 MAG: HesA/MoeB/ThiF family protein [Pedobacter sp.]
MRPLSTLKRYDRQITLPELGVDGQQRLLNTRVLVVGAGGLGCPLLLYLVGAGIGHIGIIDDDIVDETNLHRQVLFQMSDIGRHKADVAAAKLQLFNPDVQFTAYPFRLTDKNAARLIGQYDLVIDGSDNFPTRYLVNDTCVSLNKTLVFGSIFQFEGQISVFNFNGGPDYRSIYPEPPLPDEVPNCGESGVIGTLPGIIGSIMANEAIKVICGFGEVLSGQLLVFNALNNETQRFNFGKTSGNNQLQHIAKETTAEIQIQDLEQWKTDQIDYQLVDLREAYEYEEYNIGGVNIPLYSLNDHLNELSATQRIVLCCSAGKRSKIAMHLLKGTFNGEVFSLILPAKVFCREK